MKFVDGGGPFFLSGWQADAIIEDFESQLVVLVPQPDGNAVGVGVFQDVVNRFLIEEEQVALGLKREFGGGSVRLAIERVVDFPKQAAGGFTHALDKIADGILTAFQQPDNVPHGKGALAGDGFHFSKVSVDFLGTLEASEVLAGSAGDQRDASEVASDVIVQV